MVSIITPMYNGERFIAECIESVQAQTFTDWEMIVVDDYSSEGDHGADIAQGYADKDARIRIIRSYENKGSSGTRNIALKEARGRYIAFLDCDDVWHADFLEHQLEFMKYKDASLVFSSYKRIDEDTKEEILRPFIVPDKVNYSSLLRTCPIFPSTVIYDRDKTGLFLFNEKMGSLRDDYAYWLNMLKKVDYAFGNSEILVDYRMRKTSVTGNKKKVIVPQWRVLRDVEKLPLYHAVYCIAWWAVASFFKYRK